MWTVLLAIYVQISWYLLTDIFKVILLEVVVLGDTQEVRRRLSSVKGIPV